MSELSREELQRYSRHLIMPEVALEGQLKLKQAKVLLIGTGGLGSPAALYLAAAGIGTIGIVDFDVVDHSNLQRQVIHGTSDVGRSKLDSAEDAILDINPHVRVVKHEGLLASANAFDVIAPYDVVIDGTDNFPTRYLVNDACVLLKKPNVYGSIFRFDGQASLFAMPGQPCYRCLYPEPPPPGTVPSCAEGGVLGILPGVIGTIQATEAIKLVLGKGRTLAGRLLLYDALDMNFREVKIKRDPACPVCGDQPTIHELIDYNDFCGVSSAIDNRAQFEDEVEPEVLQAMMKSDDPPVLIDVREPHETAINRIQGSRLIPLGELPAHLGDFDKDEDIVVHCLAGSRSAQACHLLKSAGFTNVHNLKGGIRAWIEQVDPSLPSY